MEGKLIFQSMQNVMLELGAISKDSVNQAQKWSFRSIDAMYNALHPLLAKHGIFIIPTVIETKVTNLEKGTSYLNTVKYTFYALDGSSVEAILTGQGADFGDKANAKSLTMAFKYLLMQSFCIALETEKDPDSEIVVSPPAKNKQTKESKPSPVSKQQDPQLLIALAKVFKESNIGEEYIPIFLPKARTVEAGSYEEFKEKILTIYDEMSE